MRSHRFRGVAGGGVTAPYRWSLDDSPSPFADTGRAGEARDMTSVGTVSDDPTFGGISLSGSGAVSVADSADWVSAITSGADKQFTIKVRFSLTALGVAQLLVGKNSATGDNRQFFILVRPNGDLDFLWYADGSSSPYRIVRTAGAISAGVEYVLDVLYDGTIDTGDGQDRVAFYLDGTLSANTALFTSGALHDINNGAAELSVGAEVGSTGSLGTFATSGSFADVALYDYLIGPDERG